MMGVRMVNWILLVAVTLLGVRGVNAQSRSLEVNPQFEFVNEDWDVDRALPDLSICASDYRGNAKLDLRITTGDSYGHFTPRPLNNTCWTLILKKRLDADLESGDGTRGQFFSLAFRCNECGTQKEGNLDIQVVDINDNPPQFVDTESAVSVSENASPNQVIFSVTTFDPDTGVGGIDSFRLVDDFDGTFQVRNGSCSDSKCRADVYLMKPVHYETRNVYPLEIISFDGAGRIQTVNTVKFKVVINILDVQNNPPKFVTDNRIRYVPEDSPVGSKVFQVEAVDGDAGVATPNRISYSLLMGTDYFRIEESTGWVVVAKKLDREDSSILKNNGAITLTIQAEEETNVDPRPRLAVNFTVLITDANDEVPMCNQSLYRAQIPENSQALIPITLTDAAQLYVFDKDQGSNGEFAVSLEGPAATWFDVNPKVVFQEANLLIRVRNSSHLDYESIQSVDIRVVLTPKGQSGQSPGGCDVKIVVLDSNDNPPTFNQSEYSGTVMENQNSGTFVAKITVFDIDTTVFLPILLSLSGVGAERFTIDSQGNVRTVATLNREETPEYRLTVQASDDSGRGNPAKAALQVTVLDINDEAPKFEREFYTAYLFENTQKFTQLPGGKLFVKATDSDAEYTNHSKVSYFLDPPSENFTIHETSGQIVPKFPGVDRDKMTTDYLNLTVVAKDKGRPRLKGSAKVVIYVNDSNDNAPVFQQPKYHIQLSENATAGTFVIQVSAIDRDRSEYNSRLAYRITDVQDKFLIDSTTGLITVANGASLDPERTGKTVYDLEVEAVDQGFPQRSGTTKAQISIKDINNKDPKFPEKLHEVAVYEHAPVYTAVINLTAFDPDESAKLRYEIVGYLNALTKDGRPVITQQYNYSTLFGIKPETGEVYTKSALDREQLQHLTVIVNATDENAEVNFPQEGQTFLDITILDINDNPPKFEQASYTKTVQENAEIGAVIMSVTANDPDSNGTVLYSLSKESGTLVKMNNRTGEITVSDHIDFEKRRWINFTAISKDTGTPALISQVPVNLKVIDQNDNSPVFHPALTYKTSILENATVGSFVIRVNATDLDSGNFGKIAYFLLSEIGTGSTKPKFVINQTTGEIRVNDVLDREVKESYALTVQAVDDYTGHVNPDSHEATAVVEVQLIDVNDNPPEFSPNTPRLLTLTESNTAGLQVATFAAIDKDDTNTGNGRVRYFLAGGNATVNPIGAPRIKMFDFEPQSGLLTLATDLTGLSGVYVLNIEARDLGKPQPLSSNISVTIQVQDYNDNKPIIYHPEQKSVFTVPENNYTDFFVVVAVRARDKDEGDNADLRYRIKQTTVNDDWKYFTVDPISGDVYLRQELDFEKQQRYALTVQACDSGKTPLCDEVEFFVSVKDENDNCPYFDRTLNFTEHLNVMENQQMLSSLGVIKPAVDKDTALENSRICYKIVERIPPTAPFQMARGDSPEIVAAQTLDREKRDSYALVIRASDCNRTGLCAQYRKEKYSEYVSADKSLIMVKILVLDANDNPPHFVQTLFRGGLQYDTKIGSRVTRVRAVDADTVDSGKIRYSFLGPIIPRLSEGRMNTGRRPFNLNASTGDLTTNIVFQPAWKGIFELTVLANDSAGQTDTAKVVINLLSFDQQVELVFESTANQVWDEAPQIIKLLSEVTESNATIDDVQPYDKMPGERDLESQSSVLVHFIEGDTIIPVDQALQFLDLPKTANQISAKQKLISFHRLKYAGQNAEPMGYGSPDYTLYFALAGVIGGLLLILLVLVAIWCTQNRNYKRKLKAATTLAFGSNEIAVPSYDVPGTNLHSNSNPVWSPNYTGMENYAIDYDRASQGSHNSLDENEVDDKDTASTDADRTLPSRHTNINGYMPSAHALNSKNNQNGALNNNKTNSTGKNTVAANSSSEANSERTVSQQSRSIGVESVSKNGSTISAGEIRGPPDMYETSRGTSPPPNYPQPIMASLESTEL